MDIVEFINKHVHPKGRRLEIWTEPDGSESMRVHVRLFSQTGRAIVRVSHVDLVGALKSAARELR